MSYGAFTYGLCEALDRGRTHEGVKRKKGGGKKVAAPITFERLIAEAVRRVQIVASGPQTPQLVCPEFRRTQTVI